MKLTRLRLENFRSFGPAPSDIGLLDGVTAFVGNNGAGKTAIMAALARLFGVGAGQRGIRKSDFHVGVGEAGPANGDELAIDCIFAFPGGADDPVVPEIIRHMSIGPDGAELLVRIRLQASWSDDGTSDGLIDEEVRWVPTGGDAFDWSACARVNASDRALVQLVYVPANRNAYDQVTALLKGRLWRAARWSGDLQAVVEAGAIEIQGRFDAEAPAALIIGRLEERWRQVHLADTDAVPRLGVSATTLDDLVRRAEFLFSPGPAGRERRLGELSDGQRSLFHIALTAATIEVEQAAWAQAPADCVFDQDRLRRTYLTLLAIEEPENSLSPFFLSRIMLLARDLAALGGAQVLVSSHSASILGRVEPEEVRHVRLDPAARRSAVRELTLPTAGGEAGNYVRLAIRAYPELYFARFVILAEGESEAIVLPRVAEAMGMPLDRSFVPIVPLGGRFVHHFWRLLRELEIPHATLLDLDAGRKHGGASTVAYAVQELRRVGRDLAANPLVLAGEIDPREVDEIEDADLVEDDQRHAWLRALREEGVFFSTPIDLDFAMLCRFSDAYRVVRPGGRGPRMGADAVREKKATVLKTDGTPAIYNDRWDELFAWYPYLFLGASKPATHLAALGRIAEADLHVDAPPELLALLEAVRRGLGL